MTGKSDIGDMSNLPSHLSQPSRRRKCTDFCQRHTMPFRSGKSRFWSKPGEGKVTFTVPLRLAPVARRVAACGPLCGLAGRRWGTDTFQPIWARVGELFGAPKAKQEKGRRRGHPRPGHFCPQCGQLRRSTSGVVEGDFRRAAGSRTEMIPQLREKLRGRGKISRRKMK